MVQAAAALQAKVEDLEGVVGRHAQELHEAREAITAEFAAKIESATEVGERAKADREQIEYLEMQLAAAEVVASKTEKVRRRAEERVAAAEAAAEERVALATAAAAEAAKAQASLDGAAGQAGQTTALAAAHAALESGALEVADTVSSLIHFAEPTNSLRRAH